MSTPKYYVSVLLSILVPLIGLISGCSTQQSGTESGRLVFQDDFKDPKSGWFVYKL